MKVLVFAVVVALMGAAAARADQIPAGFVVNARLSGPASFVAGKPVAVYCAPSQRALSAVAAGGATDALGVTPTVGGTLIYLAPQVCFYLGQWLAGKKPSNLYGVAGSLQTLAHEAEHTKGIRDETDADCASLVAMVSMVTRYFPLHGRMTMHKLMALAWSFHDSKSIAYTARAC